MRAFRVWIPAVMVATLLASTGCATYYVTHDARENMPVRYMENVRSVLLASNQRTMVIIGEKYDYAFEDAQTLISALNSPAHAAMQAGSFEFKVTAENAVEGALTLMVPADNGPAAAAARALGFTEGDGKLQQRVTITGKRYAKTPDLRIASEVMLNQPYAVAIEETSRLSKKPLAILPAAVAADIVTAPVMLPLMMLFIWKAKSSGLGF